MNYFAEYKKIIKPFMGELRYNHCINVAKEAQRLAEIYGADKQKAATAGILHDITKEMSKEEQLQIMTSGGIILDDIQKNAPKLWHSISGSVYVRDNLGINDEDILNAIRFHTTGRAGMSLLEKIIFVADFTSDERNYKGIVKMRKKSRRSLEDAMLYGLSFTFSSLTSRGLAVHIDELECYNEIVLNRPAKGKVK